MLFREGWRNLACITRTLLRLLLRRMATIRADLNMLQQRRDEVKMLKSLQMMDEMERRAGLFGGVNRTHSDLSIVVVVTFWGKSASLRVTFLACVISCWRKCRL